MLIFAIRCLANFKKSVNAKCATYRLLHQNLLYNFQCNHTRITILYVPIESCRQKLRMFRYKWLNMHKYLYCHPTVLGGLSHINECLLIARSYPYQNIICNKSFVCMCLRLATDFQVQRHMYTAHICFSPLNCNKFSKFCNIRYCYSIKSNDY